MSKEFYSSRAFSLPKYFLSKHLSALRELGNNDPLLNVFDNNRYLQRDRLFLIPLGSFSLTLFDKSAEIEYQALIHSSDNLVVIARCKTNERLEESEVERIKENWIPRESLFKCAERELNIRHILNFGFFLFFARLNKQERSLDDFFNMKELTSYQYVDADIRMIERIYSHFGISKSYFFIPSMYGSSFIVDPSKLSSDGADFGNGLRARVERNAMFVNDHPDSRYYCYGIAYFNLLKHLKNRVGSEISLMLDDIGSTAKSDYPSLLEKSSILQRDLTVNYDEFNNINIWHNDSFLVFSRYVRSQSGWNLEQEFCENSNKLKDFVDLTTEMSKGKFQSFMDTISLLIGILGVFAFFDLVQILNDEPYTNIHWVISFSIIIILLPIFLIFMAKKSRSFMRFINRFL